MPYMQPAAPLKFHMIMVYIYIWRWTKINNTTLHGLSLLHRALKQIGIQKWDYN